MVERSLEPARTRRRLAAVVLAALAGTTCAASVAAPAQAAALPNLVVTGITWTTSAGSTTPTTGAPVTFSATIKNTGSAATPKGVIHGVQFRVDGNMVTWADASTASLAPGQSRTVTATGGPAGSSTWAATDGSHRINAMVDDAKRITESQEHDNTRDASMTVGAATGTVSSTVSTDGGVRVVSTLGPSSVQTTTNSRVTGHLSVGCFNAAGKLVNGTSKDLGEWTFGNPRLGPGNDPGIYTYVVSGPNATTTTVNETVTMKSILRDAAAYVNQASCPVNTTPGYEKFRVTKVESNRYDMTGTSGLLSSSSRSVDATFTFGAPSRSLTSTVSANGTVLEVHSTMPDSIRGGWVASSATGRLVGACFEADGSVVKGSGRSLGTITVGDPDRGPGDNSGFYAWTPAGFSGGTSDGVITVAVLIKNAAGYTQNLRCSSGTTAGLYRLDVTRLQTALHLDGGSTLRWSGAASTQLSFDAPASAPIS